MIALIVSGSVIFVAVIAVVAILMLRRSRKIKSCEHDPKVVVPDESNVTRTKIEPLEQPPATTNATVPTSQDLTTDMIALDASNLPN